MATTNKTPSQTREELDRKVSEKYSTVEGVEPSETSVGGDDHPITDALGDEDHFDFEYDPRATGISIAERYDEPAAALREYIHNAETACIRRMRQSLIEVGYTEDEVLDMSISELRERAREEAGYEPIIEITHTWPECDAPALVISDNGIGISVEEFMVMKKHAHSTSFLDGQVGGNFGQGIYSGFMLVGREGKLTFSTKSVLDDATYGMRMNITGFNPLPNDRNAYGTTFSFPSFSEKGRDVEVFDKVGEYSQGLRVPVQYTEYDDAGEHVVQEDWTPSKLEDALDESAPVVTYESNYARAVASPAVTSGDRSPQTLVTSMPIERNDGRYSGTRNDKFESPWKFDIRLKYEDGRVAVGPHAGLVPVDEVSYEKMSDERQDHYVPRSELTASDIEMPKPVDDRDRLRDGHRDFFEHVSKGLSRNFADQYAEVLAQVDEFEDLADMEPRERTLFLRGYSHFGPSTNRTKPENIQETLEDEVGVTVPLDVCEKLGKMKSKLDVVPRNCANPSKKGGRRGRNRTEKRVWEIVAESEPSGDVYMGVTIGSKKCHLAWELDENNIVIQVESTSDYSKWTDMFGWTKLKELPSWNLEEKFGDQLSDSFIEQWDDERGSGTTSHGRGSYDRDRAKKRSIKVRKGTGSTNFSRRNAQSVHDDLDAGNSIDAGRFNTVDTLYVLDQNEHNTRSSPVPCKQGIGRAVVPSYVKQYLLEADNVYEPDEIYDDHLDTEVTFDYTERAHDTLRLDELTERDVIAIVNSDERVEMFRERISGVIETIEEHDNISKVDSLALVTEDFFEDCWLSFYRHTDPEHRSDATVVPFSGSAPRFTETTSIGMSDGELYRYIELPPTEYDRDSPEWEMLFKTTSFCEAQRNVIEILKEHGDCVDVDEVFPSRRDT